MSDGALIKYFASSYPGRSGGVRRLLFRHGEAERCRIVREWLPSTLGFNILDAGCGDGEFLSSVISGQPVRIRLEDMVSDNVAVACSTVTGQAVTIEGMTCDTFTCKDSGFDVVLAIGLLDYRRDWQNALIRLIGRSRKDVIANVPRFDHPRNWLRAVWLYGHGVRLRLVRKKQLMKALRTLGLPFDVQGSRFEWFIRIRR